MPAYLQHGVHIFQLFLVGLALRSAKAPARAKAVVDADACKNTTSGCTRGQCATLLPAETTTTGFDAGSPVQYRCRLYSPTFTSSPGIGYFFGIRARAIFSTVPSHQEQQDQQRRQPTQHQQAPSQAAPGFTK